MSLTQPLLHLLFGAAAAVIHLALVWLTAATIVRKRAMSYVLFGSIARLALLFCLALLALWAGSGPLNLMTALAGFLVTRATVLWLLPVTDNEISGSSS